MSNGENGKFKTRKFLLTVGTVLLAFVALSIGKLSGDQFVSLIIWLVGIFSGANVVAKHKQFVEDR